MLSSHLVKVADRQVSVGMRLIARQGLVGLVASWFSMTEPRFINNEHPLSTKGDPSQTNNYILQIDVIHRRAASPNTHQNISHHLVG